MSELDPIADASDQSNGSKVNQRQSKWGKLNRDAALNPFGFIDILKSEGGRLDVSDVNYSETHDLWWDEGSAHNQKEIIDDRLEKSRFKLGKLDFSDCGLVHPLPTRLYLAFELRIMQLNDNNLTAISPALSWATNLIQLKIYGNQLIHLPAEIGLLQKLEILWAHNNHLVDLPNSLGDMTKLILLTLHENRLTSLPYTLCNCTKLSEISWHCNPITSPPVIVHSKGVEETFQYMKYVINARQSLDFSLANTGFSFLPPDANIPGLTSLSMRGNADFRVFPRNDVFLSICTSLTRLDLCGCVISELPPRCKSLFPCLKTLLMDWHNVINIPNAILTMPWQRIFEYQCRIEEACDSGLLHLDGFAFLDIPYEVFSMTHLTCLSLDNTGIYEIPMFITQLASLRKLSAQANNINSLPVCIHKMRSLERIYLCGNPITDLPLELCLMTNLTELFSYTHDVIPVPESVPSLAAFDPEHYSKSISELFAKSAEHQYAATSTPALCADSSTRVGDSSKLLSTSLPTDRSGMVLSKITKQKLLVIRNQQELLARTLIQAVMRRLLCREEVSFRKGKLTLMDQLRPLLAGPPAEFNWVSFFEFDHHGAVVNRYPPEFTRAQHVFNTFRILDSFEKMLVGIETGKVDFKGMGLSYFPREILQCTSLHTLDISDNHFYNLPEAVSFLLTGLTNLTCTHNALEIIPSRFSWMKCIVSIQMSDNKIQIIPNDLGSCTSLREINFRNNSILELPMSMSMLVGLRFLDLSHNCLSYFPSLQIGTLSSLEVCHLSHNNIRRWKGCKFSMFSLKELILDHNPISNVPWEIYPGMPALSNIAFDISRILSPDPEVSLLGTKHIMSYLSKVWSCFSTKCLDLRGLSLRQFPSEVWRFPFLNRVRINDNKITSLPLLLTSMKLLTDLDVSRNAIRSIPFHISQMSQLKHLNYAENPIHWPPTWVRQSGFAYMFKWMKKISDVNQNVDFGSDERSPNFDSMMLKRIPIDIFNMIPSIKPTSVPDSSLLEKISEPVNNQIKSGESPLIFVNRWEPNALVGTPRSDPGYFGLIGGVCRWGQITSLSFQSNSIRVLPPVLKHLSSLRILNANFNRLRYIHPELFQINIQQLHILENNLTFLPHTIIFCTSLLELCYDGNPMDLPHDLYNRRRLKIYDTWREYYGEFMSCRGDHVVVRPFPNKVAGAPGRGFLDLRNFGLPKLPMEVFYTGGGNSSTCPFWFDYKPCITHLDIRENPIMHLPSCIVMLVNLKHALFSETLIRAIPPTMALLRHLEMIEANNCVLASFPFDTKMIPLSNSPDVVRWPKLQNLSLCCNKIAEISLFITEAIQITELDLRHNGIAVICLSICHMWNLRRLDLRDNPIVRIPFEISRLSTVLTDLSLDTISIWSPPPEVMALGIFEIHRYLHAYDMAFVSGVLHLPNFGLTRAPPEVMELRTVLTELWLDNNHLETLPTIYGHLTSIVSLHVEHNRIVRLPETIGLKLLKMTDLNISNNKLTLIPLEYANLRKLKIFEVVNNPWVMLPAEIISKNLQAHYMYRVADSSNDGILALAGFYVTSEGLFALKSALPNMSQIKEVYLEENRIVYIPRQYSVMTSMTHLNISKNQLSGIPDFIDGWNMMTSCYMQCNNIIEVPNAIGFWTKCTTLFLSRNFISILPDSIRSMEALRSLHLDINRIHSLTPALGFITTLTDLRLNLNQITILPPEMAQLTSLSQLRLDGNSFKSPPPLIVNGNCIPSILSYLKMFLDLKMSGKLDISKQSWQAIPWELCYFQGLQRLDLSGNNLSCLIPRVHNGFLNPCEIQNFVSLRGLEGLHDPSCDFTQEQALYPSISTLIHLQYLNVSDNSLPILHSDIKFCTSLTEFDIRHNCVEVVPYYLQTLKHLVLFHTEGNTIRHPPSEYGETLTFDFLRKYWEKIQSCETSGTLNLSSCKLVMFPPELCENSRLFSITSYIDVSSNMIKSLPPSFLSLKRLRYFDISHNHLKEIPRWISQLLEIEEINFSSNLLTDMPEELGLSTSMKIMRCRDNRIRLNTAFWIRGMTSLEILDLTNNDLVSLPINLGFLTNFRDIGFEGNPGMLDPPPRIVALGLSAVLDFMRYNASLEQSVESFPDAAAAPDSSPFEDVHWINCSIQSVAMSSDSFQPNPISNYEPNPAAMSADGVDTSYWRSRDIGSANLVIKFRRRAFIRQIELHWYSYFAGKEYVIKASNSFGSDGSKAEWILLKDEDGASFKHADVNRIDIIPFHGCPASGIKAIHLSILSSMFKGNRLRHIKAMGRECDNDEFFEDLPFSYSRTYSKADKEEK